MSIGYRESIQEKVSVKKVNWSLASQLDPQEKSLMKEREFCLTGDWFTP